jgi:glycosyltransferase involved in cell wall biosynthesis
LVTQEYPPGTAAGGLGFNMAAQAASLVERGHEVHVLSCWPGQARADLVQDGVHVHRRPQVHVPGLHRLVGGDTMKRVVAALSARREVGGLGVAFDVVQAPEWMAEGLLLSRRSGPPVVTYLGTPVHVTAPLNNRPWTRTLRWADLLERTSVRRAAAVTTTSQLLADQLSSEGWLGTQTAQIIFPPLDLATWTATAPVDGTGPVVLAVGRVEPRKGPEVLVRAAGQLARDVPGLEVVFAGKAWGERDGRPYGDWLAALADEVGAPCRFLGQSTKDDVAAWYAKARVVAVPSTFDSFSLVTVEGMAAGRPVVVSDRVGAGDLVKRIEPGDVVPVDDATALAHRLLIYLENPHAAADVGRRARALVVEECSPVATAAKREALFEEAIRQWPRRK